MSEEEKKIIRYYIDAESREFHASVNGDCSLCGKGLAGAFEVCDVKAIRFIDEECKNTMLQMITDGILRVEVQ